MESCSSSKGGDTYRVSPLAFNLGHLYQIGKSPLKDWKEVNCVCKPTPGAAGRRQRGQPQVRSLFLSLASVLLLLAWTSTSARAAEVRCRSGLLGQYNLHAGEAWYQRRWPSGARPTNITCAHGFISGLIEKGDYEKVRTFYRQNHPFLNWFDLASPGGDVVEAIKIGQLLRNI